MTGDPLAGDTLLFHPVNSLTHKDDNSENKKASSSTWNFNQILEHIDIGILVLDLDKELIEYHNSNFIHVLADNFLCHDYRSLCRFFTDHLNLSPDGPRSGSSFGKIKHKEKILVCSVRRYGQKPVKKFCQVVGAQSVAGRFIPGMLTNPLLDTYMEAEVLIICDPHADRQALSEAQMARIPVVSLIDTDDSLTGVDLAIPTNNRGRKALSLIFFLLARQILRERGDVPPDGELSVTMDDFESKIRPITPQ